MIPAQALSQLATIGLSADQAEAVAAMLRAVEDATRAEANSAIESRRASDRARKERQRHGKSRDITGHHVTERDTPLPNREVSPTPPLEINPSQSSLRSELISARGRSQLLGEQAAEFYRSYPKKINPKDSLDKFLRVVKAGADPVQIIAAAKRFAEAHAAAGTDKQFIPAPAVWLNKGGYLSEDLPQSASVVPFSRAGPSPPRTNLHMEAILESKRNDEAGITIKIPGL